MYQFQVEYTYEDYLALSSVHEKRKSWKQRARHIALIVLLTDMVVALAFSVAGLSGHLRWVLPFVTLIGIIVSIKQIPEANAKASQSLSGKNLGKLSITLDEEGLECRSQNEKTQYSWNAYIEGYHYRGYYLLYLLDKKHATILPERALVEGDPAALRAFLEEKLQKEIIDVR